MARNTGRGRKTERKIIVEETWICSSCSVSNLGRLIICGACGNPKEKGEIGTLPADLSSSIVTDPELLKTATAGADWICASCGSRARAPNGNCAQCGNVRPETSTPSQDTSAFTPATPPRSFPEPEEVEQALRVDHRPAVVVLGAVVLLAFILGLGYLIMPHQKNLQVTQIGWSVVREVEQRQVNNGSGWGTAAAGAYNVHCVEKKRGEEKCRPHDCNPHPVSYDCHPYDCHPHQVSYDCNCDDCNCRPTNCKANDNGFQTCDERCDRCCDTCNRTEYDTCYETCTRTEYDTCHDTCDIMDNWCTYQYDTWPQISKKETHGDGHQVIFPALQAQGRNQRLLEYQYYIVTFTDGRSTWTYNTSDRSDYDRFDPGETWRVTTRLISNSCKPITQL